MVHNLNEIESWRRQGEEYLRKARSKPPFHLLIAAARAKLKRQLHLVRRAAKCEKFPAYWQKLLTEKTEGPRR